MSFSPAGRHQVMKVLVVGGPETGKTCLLQSFNGGVFDEMYVSTVKSDLVVKELKIGNMDVSAQLWDIGGSSPMGKSFLRGTHAVLLVADLTSCGSMDGLDALYERVRSLAGFADDSFPCALVGNKLDLVVGEHSHHREVTVDDLRLWAKARRPQNPDSISFYETSAKEGTNVSEAFENLVCLAVTQPAKHLATPSASLAGGGSIVGPGSHYAGSEVSASAASPAVGAALGFRAGPGAAQRTAATTPATTTPVTGTASAALLSLSGKMMERTMAAGAGAGAGAHSSTQAGADDLATAKVIIAGSPRVGKTCILRRFVGDDTQKMLERYEPTIGADFRIAQMPLNNDKNITLQLWDSAGDEKTLSIGRSLYKNADCLVLVYDITSRDSFEALKIYWGNYIMYGRPYEPEEFPCILVGNKCDLGDQRAVPLEEVLDWCTYQRPCKPITYMECSALRSINIKDIFVFVGDAIYDYTLRMDGSDPEDDETEGSGSVYTTETGETGTGAEDNVHSGSSRNGRGGGGGSSSRRHRDRDRDVRSSKTPLGKGGPRGSPDAAMEQGCWMLSCVGL